MEVSILCSNILSLFLVSYYKETKILFFCYSYFFIYPSINTDCNLTNVVYPYDINFKTSLIFLLRFDFKLILLDLDRELRLNSKHSLIEYKSVYGSNF